MINLALRSEYTFKEVYGHLKKVVDIGHNGTGFVGIADNNNTFAHIILEKECKSKGIKPIYGVRLEVVPDEHIRTRGVYGPTYLFIAKNEDGFAEINNLCTKAWKNFYYKPMIQLVDMLSVTDNVFVISDNPITPDRLDYLALTNNTPRMLRVPDPDVDMVYINNNFYPTWDDKEVYQLMCGTVKRGEGYNHKFNNQTYAQHIMSENEFKRLFNNQDALLNTYRIAEQCNVKIPKATVVKFKSSEPVDLAEICKIGAKEKGIDIEQGIYAERFEYEMKLIKDKNFVDYFLIVSDLIRYAKQMMFVGPSRGSAAGSLVCYLCGITEIDPLKHGLLFERFIDINRNDLPDIDIDFPDDKRDQVIEYIFQKYGSANVCHISNVNKMKAKSAIAEFGQALCIPKYEVDILKDSIVDRSGGDARAAMAVADTIDTTEAGKQFIAKYPAMNLVKRIEGHAAHAGKHAAGIIVCNEPLSTFGAVNLREGSIQMDKKAAEYVNLMKIDVLGLRTLTILEDAAKQVGFDFNDYYTLPLDNEAAFKLLDDMRLYGIFQFEGQAMRMLCSQMGVKEFNDIVALTALARPGPLHSGGADEYVKRRIGKEEVKYISNHPDYIAQTKETYGVIVYQEQLMNLCRTMGQMEWDDIAEIRRAASKTLGKEYFDKFRNKFLAGTANNGIEEDEAIRVWENMMTFGSWGMNKSHTVAYGLISYWCAYMKANHALEFVAANLRHAKSEDSAIRILRDAYECDGIEYIPFDADLSEKDWSVKDGKLLGGLINLKGVGDKKAEDILKMRDGRKKFTPSIVELLMNPVTCYDTIYPCYDKWKKLYENPGSLGLPYINRIKDCVDAGVYYTLGKLMHKDLRDLNEYNELVKRGGKAYTENNFMLKMVIEDDTDSIHCKIGRFAFDRLNGKHFAETGVEGETYYLIKGKLKSGWRIIEIEAIYDLTADKDNILGDLK